MSIDKIGGVNNYNNYNKINKTDPLKNNTSADSINISNEAMNVADVNKVKEIVNNTPDVRADRVKELKEKMKDPNYINDAMVKTVSENIMKNFGI